jgi:predicted DNA-binding transcriptional regulator AlpA
MEPIADNANRLDPLMNLREVAKIIGRSVREVWREIDRGRLPKPVPGRPARLFESDVVKYQERLRLERDGRANDGKAYEKAWIKENVEFKCPIQSPEIPSERNSCINLMKDFSTELGGKRICS